MKSEKMKIKFSECDKETVIMKISDSVCEKKSQLKKEQKVMVLGDSLVRELGGRASVELEVRAYPGIGVGRMKRVLEKVSEKEAEGRGVILHVGSNDIIGKDGWGRTRLTWEMEGLVQIAVKKFGVGKVVVSGLLYRRGVECRVVDGMNKFLSNMCQINNVCFLEGNSWLSGGWVQGREGVDLSQVGSKAFGYLLCRVGKRIVGVK